MTYEALEGPPGRAFWNRLNRGVRVLTGPLWCTRTVVARQCTLCGELKELTEFSPDASGRDGRSSQCRECRNLRRRERWRDNVNGCRDKQKAAYGSDREARTQYMRASDLRRKFRLTVERYDELLLSQRGVCALCDQPESKVHHRTGRVMNLAVDHDHECCAGIRSCGECIRGLLCYECNLLIGKVEAKPKLRARFADYLSRRPLSAP